MKFLCAVVVLLGVHAFADELAPAQAAQVSRDRQKALEEVAKKYGNKKPSELSPDERRQMIRDQADAEKKAYEKNGVDAKDVARFEATASKEQRAAAKQEAARADKKEADAKKAAEARPAAGTTVENGIVVERNTGEVPPPAKTARPRR